MRNAPPPPPPPNRKNKIATPAQHAHSGDILPITSQSIDQTRNLLTPVTRNTKVPPPPAAKGKEGIRTLDTANLVKRFEDGQRLRMQDSQALQSYSPQQLHSAIQAGKFRDKELLRRAAYRSNLAALREHAGVLQRIIDEDLLGQPPPVLRDADPVETYMRVTVYELSEAEMDAHLQKLDVQGISHLLRANGVTSPRISAESLAEKSPKEALDALNTMHRDDIASVLLEYVHLMETKKKSQSK